MSGYVHVKGLAELQQLMDQLPAKIEANVMRGALRAGMKPVKGEAQHQLASHGSVETGALADGLKISTSNRRGVVTSHLRVTGKHAFVANWLEFTGAHPHEIKPKARKSLFIAGLFGEVVQHPGFHKKPFLRPALDAKAGEAVVITGEYIKQRLATKNGLDTSNITIGGDDEN